MEIYKVLQSLLYSGGLILGILFFMYFKENLCQELSTFLYILNVITL